MNFKKNDYVLVKEDFTDEIKFSGFGGRIQRIYKNGPIQVVWDSITLKKLNDDYIRFMIENEYYLFDYNFSEDEIYLAEPRDTMEMMFEAQEKLYDKKLSLLKNKPEKIEEYYDRFVLSPYYWKLTDTQKNKSWDIINIFSSIMRQRFGVFPDRWNVESFAIVYTKYFRENVVASKAFFQSSKRVLSQYAAFLQEKNICNSIDIQNYLKNTKVKW